MNKYIDLQCRSIQSIQEAEPNGMLVTNPPYGERISVEDMEGLYQNIGERLKRVFKGYKAWIIGYKEELFDCIGLKPSVKMPLLNGDLNCELREYAIFEGKYDDLRKEGGSIKDDDFSRRKGGDKPYRKAKFEETFKSDRRPRHFDDDDNERRGKGRFAKNDRAPRHFRFNDNDDEPRQKRDNERFARRRDDDRRPRRFNDDRRRFNDDDNDDEPRSRKFVHSEEFSKRVVKFREPQLSKDSEIRIDQLRRRGWKKNSGEGEEGGSK